MADDIKSIKAVGERILIKPDPVADKTEAGIYLPEAAREDQQIGTVLSVGQLVDEVDVGDRVIYQKFHVTEMEVDGQVLFLGKEEDVIGKLEA